MRKRAGDDRVAARVTRTRFIREPVHAAIARTHATVFELAQRLFDLRLEQARAPRCEVGRLERGREEAIHANAILLPRSLPRRLPLSHRPLKDPLDRAIHFALGGALLRFELALLALERALALFELALFRL